MNKRILSTLLVVTIVLNTTFAQNTIFDNYPWLTDLVQPNDCSISSVELYEQSIFHFLLVTDEKERQQLYFENGTFYCQNSTGFDCVTAYNLGDPVDSWSCGDEASTCLVTITNTQCRVVKIYDTADNLLTTMTPDRPLPPSGYTPPQWTDPRPLGESETRTYIFKENNLVLGQQTVSCDNKEISTVSAYFNSCTDALGFDEFENIGCRTLTVYNTNSQVVFTLEPGAYKAVVQSIPIPIYIILADSDTIAIGRKGSINSGGCEANSSIPDDFQDYNVIYRICQGETLTIPNPYRDVQCPVTPGCPGICENFPFRQPVEWMSSTGEIVTTNTPRPGETFVTFAPTETTIYEGTIPTYRCGAGPSGPQGNPLKYLVIVEEREDCQEPSETDLTNFVIRACIGEKISIPIPYHPFCSEGFILDDNDIIERINFTNNVMELKVLGSGKVTYSLTNPMVQVGEPSSTQPKISVSCPIITYQFDIQLMDDCPVIPPQNNAIFDDFPWLNNLVDPANCTTESIAVYEQGIFQYLLVTDAEDTSILYNQDGLFYCQNTSNFDCATAYGFDEPTSIWNCGESNPPPTPDCSKFTGTIFYENCDDGRAFYFIETTEGQIFDPYFEDDYFPADGQVLNFDFVDAAFNTPCSIAEKAIAVTCYELVEPSLFSKYPFLLDIVDPDNCQTARIEEYDLGAYAFVHVNMGNGISTLYYQDGTFYCQDAPNYDCRSAYNLTTPTETWTCSNLAFPATERQNFPTNKVELIAFPNPTTRQLRIDISSIEKNVSQLQIIDMMGRIVRTIELKNNLNHQPLEVDLSAFQNGVYFIKYGRAVEKIIKQGLE